MSASATSPQIEALPPPPGVTPNFTDPYCIGEGLIAAGMLFVILTTLSTAVRLHTKFFIIKIHADIARQLSLLLEIIYHPVIAITRLSICLQFIHIFVVGHSARFWCIQGFILVSMMYYLAEFFVRIFQCKPIAKNWNPALPGHCIQYGVYHTGIFNMLSDVVMLLFPLFCTWNLNLSTKRKLQVSAVFFVGTL